MKQYNYREFEKLVIKNGYRYARNNGSHAVYVKGTDSVVFPKGHEVSAPMAKRLIKEHNLIEN